MYTPVVNDAGDGWVAPTATNNYCTTYKALMDAVAYTADEFGTLENAVASGCACTDESTVCTEPGADDADDTTAAPASTTAADLSPTADATTAEEDVGAAGLQGVGFLSYMV